jgi:hypothetical protein
MFRIELKDGGPIGKEGTHRYYLDDFCVSASNITTELLETAQENLGLKIYPNPTSSILNLEITNKAVERLTIRDVKGSKVRVINMSEKFSSIDISDLENGLYFLQVEGQGLNQFRKFIKQ